MTENWCVVTGSRAEYGLLKGLIDEIRKDPDLNCQLVVTGSHLSPEFGKTARLIQEDGIPIASSIEMILSSDTPVGVSKSLGVGILGMADAFDRLKPNKLILLGDRFEILAAAQIALIFNIPIAHIHGGETTEGSIDNAMRNAITQMAEWHFPAAEIYQDQLTRMGISRNCIFYCGAPGLDCLSTLSWMSLPELESSLDFTITPPLFLITYHPNTKSLKQTIPEMRELLDALRYVPGTLVFTHPNTDAGGRILIEMIETWIRKESPNTAILVPSLGQRRYLSLMKLANVVVGNSSSGMIEAPALKTATVNIGTRQKGRLKASSIIDCDDHSESIRSALVQALSEDFQKNLESVVSLYGAGQASLKIKNQLKIL